jgi:hypothetical protein
MSHIRVMSTIFGHCKYRLVILAFVLLTCVHGAHAWDHPAHMTTAAIAFAEIERERPELIEKIGLIMLKHPDPPPFSVAAGDATGKERARRMFIEASRWPDDTKGTIHDRPSWHSARWAVVSKDAPPEVRKVVRARGDNPSGQAIEAAVLNCGVVSSTESNPTERALSLGWLLHIVGDIHQPLHVADLYSKGYPTGSAAGTLQCVEDPLKDSTIPLHMLWDSNSFRTTKLEDIDRNARELVKKYPRSTLPELTARKKPDAFREWARESYRVADGFAYGIKTVSDPNRDANPDRVVANMVKYILHGISPVKEAPKVPADYWEKLQDTAHRRIALAGYRLAALLISVGDRITAERALSGRLLELDPMPRHGTPGKKQGQGESREPKRKAVAK